MTEVVPPMTLDGKAAQESGILKITNAALLLLAVILLIAGFPSFLFGLFLAFSQANGMEGDVAPYLLACLPKRSFHGAAWWLPLGRHRMAPVDQWM